MRLGIDFGTTRTVVSAAAGDGRYCVATFDIDGAFVEWLPTMATWHGRSTSFGDAARQSTPTCQGAVASIKRLLCTSAPADPAPTFEGGLSTLELCTDYLRWVRRMLLERSNLELEPSDPIEAMIAVPANASTRQRYLTLEAFRRAGFHILGMVNEPTAAAIEFAHRHINVLSPRSPRRYVVVYDLGGGTFDTAAVSLVDRRFSLLTSRGISRLGGADFDERILEAAAQKVGLDLKGLPLGTQVELLERAREAKETLRPTSRRLLIDLSPADPSLQAVVLEAAEIYERCQPLIERTVRMVDELFEGLCHRGIDPEDTKQLGALYLVGGSSAFPPLCRILRARYGRKIKLAPQPHAATAIGLAVAADPAAEVFVREALTRHFGVWREANGGREKIFDPILSKDRLPGDDTPLVVERHYQPAHAIGHLRFLECSELGPQGEPAGDVTPWEDVRFPYTPELAERSQLDDVPIRPLQTGTEVVERYVHHLDGTIAVDIENRTHGYRRSYVLGALN
jgi:molecular chaperone DnaK (HSP70)